MEIIKKIFGFIFRKKSINSAIYVVVLALIREAVALGYDESFEELFNRFAEKYDTYEVDIFVLILQIVFTKGSWTTLFILVTILAALLVTRFWDKIVPINKRPRIDFHKIYAYSYRKPLGVTKNNPKVIRVGIDKVERQWELKWDYKVEIRNNSSETVYEFNIEFENKPPNAFLKSEIGKFEPIKVHEKKEVSFSIIQLYTGYFDGADEQVNNPNHPLLKDLILVGVYKNEERKVFSTKYSWDNDINSYE